MKKNYLFIVIFIVIVSDRGHGQDSENIQVNQSINDISHLDNTMQLELGFPRIEHILESYEQTIKQHAHDYGLDWRFVLAVMNQESRFLTQAVSHRGAFGLMQIMPHTGRDISDALGIDNVTQPEDNIVAGIYYLWWVYTKFISNDEHSYSETSSEDRLQLALAAYNGGPTRVRDAQQIARYLNLNPNKWNNIRDILPMLSSRYYTLHQYIWEAGRPTGGYFIGSPETINYVSAVMEYYLYYQKLFD